jgi:cysteine-rich repeat protein
VCGDAITWEGVEECDDGNPFPTDDCDACRLPVCGDGVQAGAEECDDGNEIAGDGCTGCVIDSVACGAGGLRATVVYEDPTNAQAAAGRMLLAYPSAVSLPGSGAATSVRQRVVNVSGTSNPVFLPSDIDTNSDTVDDTLVLVFALPAAWPPGPMATITFDCTAGTPVRAPDFDCSFNDASDAFSNAIDPTKLVCRVTLLEPIP